MFQKFFNCFKSDSRVFLEHVVKQFFGDFAHHMKTKSDDDTLNDGFLMALNSECS